LKYHWRAFAIFALILNLTLCGSFQCCWADASQDFVRQVPTEAIGDAMSVNPAATPASTSTFQVTFAPSSVNHAMIASYVDSLNDPSSPHYHHWLSPAQFGEQFGASTSDISAVVAYLSRSGFTNISVWPDRLFVTAQTSRANAESAFGVSINGYDRSDVEIAKGLSATYYAPDRQPSVDQSIASKISAIFGLSNAVQAHPAEPLKPAAEQPFASPNGYFNPSDLASAYNITSLHNAGLEGQGITVAIYSPTAFQQSDITRFLTANNIPSASVNIVNVAGQNGARGNTNLADQVEACIDIETVLGQAPDAKVNVYEAPNDGGFEIFEQVEKDDPNVLSESYGIDENEVNQAYANAYETIRQAMAAEGITIFVASGDNGAFDSSNQSTVTVSVDASSAYVTAVGGTELSPLSNNTWDGEVAWTYGDGTTSGNTGSGGGISSYIAQPSWQIGAGVQNSYSNGFRQIPDVAALASKPYYNISTEGGWYGFGGTSCSTPLWAAATALIEQGLGGRLGNINPKLYAAAASASSPFHDITSGNDGLYGCTPGWDFVTGWGSVDFGKLLNVFGGTPPTITSFSPTSGPAGTVVTLTGTNLSKASVVTFGGTVGAVITSDTSTQITVVVPNNASTGPISVVTPSGTSTTSASFTVNYVPVLTSVTVSPATATVVNGATQQFVVTAKDQHGNAIADPPTFSWKVSGGGTISSTGLFTAKTVGGPFTVTATNGSFSATASITVTTPPSFTLNLNPTSLSIKQGAAGAVTLSLTASGGFNGIINLAISGVPSGVTVTFATSGSAVIITFTASSTAPASTSTISIVGTSGSITSKATLALTVTAAPAFKLSAAPDTVTVNEGSSSGTGISLTAVNGFASTATLKASGLPTGVSASFSSTLITATTSRTVNFAASPSAPAGSYSIVISGTSGTLTNSQTITLTVMKTQILTSIVVSPTGVTLLPNTTQQFTANARDQFGAPLVTQPKFTWTKLAGGVGSVSSAGLYSAGATTGTATIQATSGSVSGTVAVKVTQPAVTTKSPPSK